MRVNLRHIFERFQNLNLVFLIEDLRRNLTTVGNWESSQKLCPVAHGMPNGAAVKQLRYLSQEVDLERACEYAAGLVGADGREVIRFVEFWDSEHYALWLLEELEAIWRERVNDAVAVQAVTAPSHFVSLTIGEPETYAPTAGR
jgi:hypothetical protein